MRWLRGIRIKVRSLGVARAGTCAQHSILAEQVRKGEPTDSAAGLEQEIASGPDVLHSSPHVEKLVQIQEYVREVRERALAQKIGS